MEERCWQRLAGGSSGHGSFGAGGGEGPQQPGAAAIACLLLARRLDQIRAARRGEPDKGSALFSLRGCIQAPERELQRDAAGTGVGRAVSSSSPNIWWKEGMGGENAGQAAGVSPRAWPHPDSLGWAV